MLDLKGMEYLARGLHKGQVDKLGVPYEEHLRAVAEGLAPFGESMQGAGWLHDVMEDCQVRSYELIQRGVDPDVVSTVSMVTRSRGASYEAFIARVATDRKAALVKIADNAHNTRPDRVAQLDGETRARLAVKYTAAQQVLWPVVGLRAVEEILKRVNPALLDVARVEIR